MMYDNYNYERIIYEYEKLENQCRQMYYEICRLEHYIDNTDEYLDNCNFDLLVDFFIKNPDKFNKITAQLRKEKIKNIEKI